MGAILLMILWTWGLTPTWVNVVSTIIIGLHCIIKAAKD